MGAPKVMATLLLLALAGCPLALSDYSIADGDAGDDAGADASVDRGTATDGSADANAVDGGADGVSADAGTDGASCGTIGNPCCTNNTCSTGTCVGGTCSTCTPFAPDAGFVCHYNTQSFAIDQPKHFCAITLNNGSVSPIATPAQCQQCVETFTCACALDSGVAFCNFNSCDDTNGQLTIRCN